MKHKILSALIILCSSLHTLWAQKSLINYEDSLFSIDDVVCVGERPHYLTPSQTISGPTLQNLSTTSVADALKYFSGVQIKDFGGLGGLKTVNVRSLGSQHVGVYLDGIRITNAQNGQVDLGRYSLSNMESVSLYNANKNERLQSATEYASAATVYMQTRKPDRTTLTAEYGTGSFGLNKVKGYFSLKDRLFVDAEYQHTDGNYKFRFRSLSEDTIGKRHNSDIRFYRLEAAGFYKGLATHVYYYNSERGLPGPVIRRLTDQWDSTDRQWDQNFFVQSSYKKLWENFGLRTNLKYSFDYLHYLQDPSTNAAAIYCNNHYTQQSVYASVAGSYNMKYLSLTASTDITWSDLNTDVYKSSYVYRLDSKSLLSAILSYRGLEVNLAMLYTHIQDHTRGNASPLRKLTPMFLASYKSGPWVVRAFNKRIFRAPTLNDLYYTQVGNRNLKPEYTRQWNIGAEYHYNTRLWAASAQADAYINHIDNRIVCLPLKGTYQWSMMNYGKTYCRGLNATVEGRYMPREWTFSLLTSFTLQHDVNRTDPEDEDTYDMPICYSPKFSCGITGIVAWRNYSLTVSDLHVSRRMWSYADPDDVLAPYDNVDVKISGSWRWLTASLEINDLFDVQYEHIPRYPMPGRTFRFNLSYTIGNKSKKI